MSEDVEKSLGNGNGEPVSESQRKGDESPPPPPDGGWGWMVVFAAFMFNFVMDGITNSFGIFFDTLLSEFHESNGNTAWIHSTLAGVTLSSGPIASLFVNRWGCRTVTIFGALLAGLGIIASIFAKNVITLIFSMGVGAGFGFGLIYLTSIISVTVWFEQYRSIATGIAVCGSGFGTLTFPPIIEALIKQYGWRKAMAAMGGFVLSCLPLGLIFRPVPEPPRTPSSEPMVPNDNNSPTSQQEDSRAISKFKAMLAEVLDFSLLMDPIFLLFGLSNFLTSIGFYIPNVYIVPMATDVKIEDSYYLVSIIGGASLIGRLVLGYISDKPWVNRLLAYNVCLIIAGISTFLAMVCREFWGLAMYSTVFGFTIGAYVGLTPIVLVDLLGLEKLTNAFGLLSLFQGIATFIGSPIAGWLYDTLHSYAPGFYVAGATILLSGLILFFIPMIEKRNKRQIYAKTAMAMT